MYGLKPVPFKTEACFFPIPAFSVWPLRRLRKDAWCFRVLRIRERGHGARSDRHGRDFYGLRLSRGRTAAGAEAVFDARRSGIGGARGVESDWRGQTAGRAARDDGGNQHHAGADGGAGGVCDHGGVRGHDCDWTADAQSGSTTGLRRRRFAWWRESCDLAWRSG